MIEDDEEADSGPMPLLVDCLLADLNARHEAQQQVLAQSRAVRKQKEQAQKIQQARLAEEVRRARDKEEAAMAATSALLAAQIKRRQSIEAGPYLEALQARSLEVLLLTEPVDEYVMQSVREYNEKKIISADSDELKLEKLDQEPEGKALNKKVAFP